MKKIYYSLLGALLIFHSCREEKIMTYNSFNFLQFTQPHTDSTIGSFLAYPDSEEIELALAVELTGIPLSKEG